MKPDSTVQNSGGRSSGSRDLIMAHLVRRWVDAEADGADPWKALSGDFPGIPADVLAAVMVEVEASKSEAWWGAAVAHVDAALVSRAIKLAGVSE